jgi:GNAT superfamily N-acetyltransferase
MKKGLGAGELIFRILKESDSIAEINALLLSAYRPLAEAGMRYAASHEDVEATKKNIENGECFLGLLDEKIIACAILRLPGRGDKLGWKAVNPSWYQSPNVTTFGRFAVDPTLQGHGIGSKMMDVLEARAKELGFEELALDTSEHAANLISMYKARGYRFIEYHQWNITNYRSVVMSKKLNAIDFIIRQARVNEAQVLSSLALISKSHWPYPQSYLDKCVLALSIDADYINNWPVFCAEVSGKNIGFFTLKTIKNENRLDNLWILPEYIGKGIGSKLVIAAIEEAKKLGWDSFRLAADPYAVGFYEKIGGIVIGKVQSKIKPDLFLIHIEFIF